MKSRPTLTPTLSLPGGRGSRCRWLFWFPLLPLGAAWIYAGEPKAAKEDALLRPPHARAVEPGLHPRLFVSPGELEALRRKGKASGRGGGFQNPMPALLAETEEERKTSARAAIDEGLRLIRAHEVPWPGKEAGSEWMEWGNYRSLAIVYDCCHPEMNAAERREFQSELLLIGAHVAGTHLEATANNHWTVAGSVLGLIAIALEGDVGPDPVPCRAVPVVRGKNKAVGGDYLPHRSGFRINSVGSAPGKSDFREGGDFKVEWRNDPTPFKAAHAGHAIVWLSGKGPAPGATYHVDYVFTPDLARWKDRARLSVARNLHGAWGQGSSRAGVQYGPLAIGWSVDLFEALRRSDGIDFSAHPAVRDIVYWLPTELISGGRNNDRNDSQPGMSRSGGVGRATDFCAWAAGRYAGDPGGRGDLARWLLNGPLGGGASWRAALWAGEDPPEQEYGRGGSLRLSRFFRGQDLANFRAGDLKGPEKDWTLFSMDAGINALGEHGQSDKGAFTFYAMGEDFAIDSGPGQGPDSRPPAAHNLPLVDGKDPFGKAARGASALVSAHWDMIHADLRDPWEGPDKWPRRAERYGVLLKSPDGGALALVADDLETDGKPHRWEWLLHTHAKNRIALDGAQALIEGAGADCAVRFLWPQPPALGLSQAPWKTAEKGTHPRLVASANGAVNPRFLALLVPQPKAGAQAPSVSVADLAATGGRAARISYADGVEDLVLWRTEEKGAVSFSCSCKENGNGRSASSDCALAILRFDSKGELQGWLAAGGSSLSLGAKTLWKASAPGDACFDGATLQVAAPAAAAFDAYAPGVDGFLNFSADQVIPARPAESGLLRWKGKRTLADTWPPGVPVLAETFEGGADAFWFVIPIRGTGFTRSVDGELCCPGLRAERISYTHRNFNMAGPPFDPPPPPRADLFSNWPRTLFTDAVLTGEVTFHDWKNGANLVIRGGVRDRRFPGPGEMEADQESAAVQEISPGNKGKPRKFELKVKGTKPGYFQWEVPEGMHVHLDNVRIEIPQ